MNEWLERATCSEVHVYGMSLSLARSLPAGETKVHVCMSSRQVAHLGH